MPPRRRGPLRGRCRGPPAASLRLRRAARAARGSLVCALSSALSSAANAANAAGLVLLLPLLLLLLLLLLLRAATTATCEHAHAHGTKRKGADSVRRAFKWAQRARGSKGRARAFDAAHTTMEAAASVASP